jgi:hypothetical protein
MAVVASTDAKKQYQNDDEQNHCRSSFPLNLNPAGGFIYNAGLSAAASSFVLRLRTGGRSQKLFAAVFSAEIKRLSIAFGVDSGCFIHGHSADGVFGRGFHGIHGLASFHLRTCTLMTTVTVLVDISCRENQ